MEFFKEMVLAHRVISVFRFLGKFQVAFKIMDPILEGLQIVRVLFLLF